MEEIASTVVQAFTAFVVTGSLIFMAMIFGYVLPRLLDGLFGE